MNRVDFLAVDLQGEVHNFALCTATDGLDSPGWPVRSSIRSMHSWGKSNDDAREVHLVAERWGTPLADVPLAVLSEYGRDRACFTWSESPSIVFPRYRYAISPRGIVMAEQFRDYQQDLPADSPLALDILKKTLVPLIERAADDVQAAGFEQDDCVMDRYITVARAGRPELVVAVESANDWDWVCSSIRQAQANAWGDSLPHLPLALIRVCVRCPVEPPNIFPAPLPATDGHIERACVPAPIASSADQFSGGSYDCGRLLAGDSGHGPVILKENATLIRIPAGREWHVTRMGHLSVVRLDSATSS